jgi:hypothetical protein
MSKQSVDKVIQRASSDARFRASLSDNFDGALRSYELSSEEKAQLAKGLGLSRAAFARPMASAEMASAEVASAEVASAEVASAEVASAEVASAEVASAEVASAEVASAEVSAIADLQL